MSKNRTLRGWRDGSTVKNTGSSSRGSEFNSRHPHGGSQLSNGSLMGSDALFWYAQHSDNIPTYMKYIKVLKKNDSWIWPFDCGSK